MEFPLEVLVATGNPSGCRYRSDWPPFGDLYVVNSDEEIIRRATVGDYVHQPFVSDIDGDGRNEVVIPGGDGLLTCLRTPGIASGALWTTTGCAARRWYLS